MKLLAFTILLLIIASSYASLVWDKTIGDIRLKYFSNRTDWESAKSRCESIGYQLAKFTQDQFHIWRTLNANPWIGVKCDNGFKWINNQSVTEIKLYHRCAKGDCGYLWADGDGIGANPCVDRRQYICSYDNTTNQDSKNDFQDQLDNLEEKFDQLNRTIMNRVIDLNIEGEHREFQKFFINLSEILRQERQQDFDSRFKLIRQNLSSEFLEHTSDSKSSNFVTCFFLILILILVSVIVFLFIKFKQTDIKMDKEDEKDIYDDPFNLELELTNADQV